MEKNEAFLKKLLVTFGIEASEHITAISTGLIELESTLSTERQAEIIETAFRDTHSMKGAARSVNLSDIETVCQALENVFAALKRKEIVPKRSLLDLLHKTINLLGELLAPVGTEGSFPEKTRIRSLISELNDAAKGIHADAAPGQQKITSGFQPSSEEITAPSIPVISSMSSDSMRISNSKLNSILLQGEGLLAVKQAVAYQSTELRKISNTLEDLKKDWLKMRPDLRALQVADMTGNGAEVPRRRRSKKKFHDFLENHGERVTKLHHSVTALVKTVSRDQRSIGAMVDGLIDDLKSVSLLPFTSLLEMIPKVIRDLSNDQGKKVLFTTTGGEIEIDKRILDEMREPLIHLIRNCIDHGIEKPADRSTQKKPEEGAIAVSVRHREGKSVEILVSDDGRGIDAAKIQESAVKIGMLSREEAKELDEQGILQLIFRSGVTTSPFITNISGRGLGLAIVRERVEKLGGSLFYETTKGKGTTFHILLPLTLTTFRGVLVRVDESTFLIPTVGIDRTLRVKPDEIRTVENRETITLDGRAISFVPLADALELPGKKPSISPEHIYAAVLGTGDQMIAFGVDEVLSEQEVIVKDLGKQLRRVRNVAGATVLGTGKVVPILNVSDLLKSAVKITPVDRVSRPGEALATKKSLLVVEDSITSRTLLKNILEASGYDVQTAVDGMDALMMLKAGTFNVVISDVDMPRMNGFDLTAKIRADKKLADVPVVLVTALESREDRERGVEVGANAYIVKSSFDKSNLLEAIQRLV
jgi:two-component system chemotaxis sensor kinase CheA